MLISCLMLLFLTRLGKAVVLEPSVAVGSTEGCDHPRDQRRRGGLTLIRVGRGEDGAVLPLHFLHFFCQRLDKAPNLLHLCEDREREVKV